MSQSIHTGLKVVICAALATAVTGFAAQVIFQSAYGLARAPATLAATLSTPAQQAG